MEFAAWHIDCGRAGFRHRLAIGLGHSRDSDALRIHLRRADCYARVQHLFRRRDDSPLEKSPNDWRREMNLGLQGKLAVVSGSTAGIGFAIAAALAAESATVIVNGRTEARVNAALDKIRQRVKNADVRGIPADLGTAEGVAAFLQQVPEADILVNNLGIFEPKPFLEIPDSDWLRFFEVNVLSGIRLSRHYLPGMLKKNWGRIIFISSESAPPIPAEMIHSAMAQTAQVAAA